MRNNFANILASGSNLFGQSNGTLLYFNPKANVSYTISPVHRKTFNTLRMRVVLTVISLIFFYLLFQLNLFLSISLSAVIFIFLEYRYHSFLKKMPRTVGFPKKARATAVNEEIKVSKEGLILRLTLYCLLAILLVVNTFVPGAVHGHPALESASYCLAVFALYMAYQYGMLLAHKEKKGKR